MIRVCCKCEKIIGEKEPLDDPSETHGYCEECLQNEFIEIEKVLSRRNEVKDDL